MRKSIMVQGFKGSKVQRFKGSKLDCGRFVLVGDNEIYGFVLVELFITCGGLRTFLLAQKSNQKRAPAIEYPPIAGWFPD